MHSKSGPSRYPTYIEPWDQSGGINSILKDKTILVADDEYVMRQFLRLVFEHFACRVDEARNGHEALLRLAHHPDLVILDVRMPVLDGFEMARMVREEQKYAGVPILALTCLDFDEFCANDASACFNTYLQKPVSVERLIEVVSFLLLFSTSVNHPDTHGDIPIAARRLSFRVPR